MSDNDGKKREYQFSGSEVVEKIKELVRQGNIRKLVIKKESGEVLFEIPVTYGVAVGAALAIGAPVLAAIGAAAALLTRVKVEVHHRETPED